MIDPELKTELDKLNRTLVGILHKTESPWRAFLNGALRGLGSVIGIVLAIALVGWVLNVLGVIPGIAEEAKVWQRMWQDTLDQVKRIR